MTTLTIRKFDAKRILWSGTLLVRDVGDWRQVTKHIVKETLVMRNSMIRDHVSLISSIID